MIEERSFYSCEMLMIPHALLLGWLHRICILSAGLRVWVDWLAPAGYRNRSIIGDLIVWSNSRLWCGYATATHPIYWFCLQRETFALKM